MKFLQSLLGLSSLKPLDQSFPLEFFDEDNKCFVAGENSVQVFDLTPRVGIDLSSAALIADSFEQTCFAGLTVTVSLLSISDIEPDIEQYISSRDNHPLARKRAEFFKSKTRNLPTSKGFCRWRVLLTLCSNDMEALREKSPSLIGALSSTGLSPRVLGTKELIELYNKVWKVIDSKITPSVYNPFEIIGPQLSDQEISLKSEREKIIFNEKIHARSLYCKNRPERFSLAQTCAFLGDSLKESFSFRGPVFITFLCHTPNQEQVAQNYLVSEVRWRRQASSPISSFIPQLSETVSEFSDLRERLQSGEKIVQQGLIVTVLGTKQEINIETNKVKQYFSTLGFRLCVAQYLQLPAFLSHLPGALDRSWLLDFKDFGITQTLLAKQAAQFMPLQAEWNGSNEPQALLTNRQGGLCFFDPFDKGADKGNFNISITGKSGSGKSNFMAYLVLERLLTGGQCFIIDVGYSYQRLGKKLGAKFVDFCENSKVSLNPFSNIQELDSESLLYLKPLVSKMCFRKRETTEIEDSLLEKSIRRAWDKHRQETKIAHISEELEALDPNLGKVLSQALYPFSKGVYSEYFSEKSSLNFEEDFIIFELEDLKDKPELQEIAMLTLIFKIQIAMYKNRHRKKYLVADEAWQLLGDSNVSASAGFLENIARRIRKFNGSLIVGTQGLDDFFTNKCGEAIFYNSDWLISLAQKEDAIDRAIAKHPPLKRAEGSLKSVRTRAGQYSEALVKSGAGHTIVRLHLNAELLALFSTDAADFADA